MLVVILEIFRDLSPATRQLRGYLLFLVGVWLVPLLVVHVQDNVHIQVVCVINYLLNAAHPVGAYRAVVAYLALPRGGYAYRVESRVLRCLYEFRSYRGIDPARFLRKPGTACGVKGIAQVPAYLDIGSELHCGQFGVELPCGAAVRNGFVSISGIAGIPGAFRGPGAACPGHA